MHFAKRNGFVTENFKISFLLSCVSFQMHFFIPISSIVTRLTSVKNKTCHFRDLFKHAQTSSFLKYPNPSNFFFLASEVLINSV